MRTAPDEKLCPRVGRIPFEGLEINPPPALFILIQLVIYSLFPVVVQGVPKIAVRRRIDDGILVIGQQEIRQLV